MLHQHIFLYFEMYNVFSDATDEKCVFTANVTNLEPLPGQRSPVEVHEDVSQALHVVPARLLDPQVGVDRGISEEKKIS